MITRLLVANRGEIARRIFRTCDTLGIGTVAVYTDADERSPHVRAADTAVRLPGNAPAESYLNIERVLEAARASGADAVHPGYGFLSENAAFARAVIERGHRWVGPPPDAIEAMGSKVEAKRLMAKAGVPVLAELEAERVTEADLPVLVKASAGGGGRGMRVVTALADLDAEVAAARAEAESAFGDGTVFLERYLPAGRHIEVQVLCDAHGTVWAVGERECSIQRRHQKIIEESPSPLAERLPDLRERLFGAARDAARAIGYVGAGTVEFLVEEDGRFHFLEMNTRLQVEHPVTECVTGLDLVGLQLGIAEGRPLPAGPPPSLGHAIEVRLYAEDPAADWRPSSGTLHRFEIPGVAAEFTVPLGTGLRLDSGVDSGTVVSPFYDPMLAKLISVAPTRDVAARALASALRRARVHGVTTNRDLLVRVLTHEAFLAGDTDTAFLDRHGLDTLAAPLADDRAVRLSLLAAAVADSAANRAEARVQGRIPSGWRNVRSQGQRKRFTHGDTEHEVRYSFTSDGRLLGDAPDHANATEVTPESVVLVIDNVRRTFAVARHPGLCCVDSALGSVALVPVDRFPDPTAQAAPGSLLAPMPGTVAHVAVTVGERVNAGQPLLWLEAMKMRHQINAPADGVVTEVGVEPGDQVEVGRVLAVVEAEET
ncbi:acetyl/propionyl-CoA carboxylase subuit alpha [Actinophytocola xinjiangensis]|uniref:Acetyl/propionyl-CoA carboxylase subuit alpha n=1 Tax=Actinophytocola xinjiangensis TaxID=485602 RepID=A0A7Z1B0Z2_9PSEU|nr:biotin carboxylase N-terminal domain-containing protein [Actinophytocola xinjiangensis]OLF13179.1 acetyl/propionyl-CoA carboxylase subuit alpha [Actinophytocola xinjiangensis]